jgi:aspartate/methionine/tyrosine aminotransferase
MPYRHFRQTISNMPANPGAEILRYGWRKPGVLSLGQGEGSQPTPDFIVKAAHDAMAEGRTFYGPVLGQPALRQEIADYTKRIFGVDLSPARVFVTGSGTTAMHLALSSILEENDEVVAITPIWKNLLGAVHLAQARTVQVPLDFDEVEGWNLDIDKLFAAVTPKTKAILVVTPSNPTGWYMCSERMAKILDFARERDIWIVSDEVYNRTAYGRTHAPSFVEHASDEDKVLIVNSFSKSWAMTGWRLGWLTGPTFAEQIIRDVALYDNMGPPTFTQYGGMVALRQGEKFIASEMACWEKNLDYLMERLGGNNRVVIHRPLSTFYGFFKVEGEPDDLTFAKRLIDEGDLGLAPGSAFGQNCEGWMRLCFAVKQEKLADALDRLEQVIGK